MRAGPNGPDNTKTFNNVRNDFNIRLKEGNDILGIGNDDTSLQALLDEFNGGAPFDPTDAANLQTRTRVPKSLHIDTGSGADAVGLFVSVGRVADVHLESGFDLMAVENSTLGDDLLIHAGGHRDGVRVRDTDVHDLLLVDLGNGDDSGSVNGIDRGLLVADGVDAGHAEFHGGSGDDFMEIFDLEVAREVKVFLDDGEDVLLFYDNEGDRAELFGGSDRRWRRCTLGRQRFQSVQEERVRVHHYLELPLGIDARGQPDRWPLFLRRSG